VGHFIFAKLLIPSLKASARIGPPNSTRVVWTSSNGHTSSPKGFINFEDVNLPNANSIVQYGQSKAVNFPMLIELDDLTS
jgi:hypothetical protein